MVSWSGFSAQTANSHLLAALALCVLLSISIEIAQAWIPIRSSSLTDLDVEYFRRVVGGGRDKGKIQISADGKQKIMR
jgi:VanZ family protein